MRQTVALIGAAGKMGSRCTDNLIKEDYKLLLCEKSEAGLKKIQEKGLKTAPTEEAVPSQSRTCFNIRFNYFYIIR